MDDWEQPAVLPHPGITTLGHRGLLNMDVLMLRKSWMIGSSPLCCPILASRLSAIVASAVLPHPWGKKKDRVHKNDPD
jgi:hypothetical protein